MDRKEVARRVFVSLWNANTSNNGRAIRVSIEDIVKDINEHSSTMFTLEQIVDAIENDPFRQSDCLGRETNVGMFETGHTNGKLTSVVLPQFTYENHRQWGVE